MSYNPAEDAYNAGKSTISQEQAVGLRGKPSKANTPPDKPSKNPTIISGATPDPNNGPVLTGPVKPVPDQELNWVQKMTKQVHDYLTRKKKENNADPNAIG